MIKNVTCVERKRKSNEKIIWKTKRNHYSISKTNYFYAILINNFKLRCAIWWTPFLEKVCPMWICINFVPEIYFLWSFSEASIWGHSGSVRIASCGSRSTTTSNIRLNANDFNKATKLIVRCDLIWSDYLIYLMWHRQTETGRRLQQLRQLFETHMKLKGALHTRTIRFLL